MRRTKTLALTIGLILTIAACGGEDSGSEATPTEPSNAEASADESTDTNPTTTTAAEQPSQAATNTAATVTLDNGEVFDFGILCALESQESAGSEILFTVVSYDDPVNLDVTQYGADSFGGAANISLYDSTTYDTMWSADSRFGTQLELSLNGSTVTGTGDFYPDGDIGATPVAGQLVANC